MDKIMEKLNKLSLPATILIASIIFGSFFYVSQVNKQHSIERQQEIKIEQEKQDQLAKDLKEQKLKEETSEALTTCLTNASEIYSTQWDMECKRLGKLTPKCISINEMTYEEYEKQNPLPEDLSTEELIDTILKRRKDFAKEKEECSCGLPSYNADHLNGNLKENKEECFRRYPQE